MVIFHSYVSLPEGNNYGPTMVITCHPTAYWEAKQSSASHKPNGSESSRMIRRKLLRLIDAPANAFERHHRLAHRFCTPIRSRCSFMNYG